MPAPLPIRVLVAHDDATARRTLSARTSCPAGGIAAAAASSLGAARGALIAGPPIDVVVTASRLPDATGIDEIVRALRPARIVVAVDGHPAAIADALRAGADAVVPLDAVDGAVVRAVAGAAPDLCLIHRDSAHTLAALCPPDVQHLLSRRELEVLACLADGLSNSQAARRLCVSRETIKSHVAHALRKLEVRDRWSAVDRATRLGLLDPGMWARTVSFSHPGADRLDPATVPRPVAP